MDENSNFKKKGQPSEHSIIQKNRLFAGVDLNDSAADFDVLRHLTQQKSPDLQLTNFVTPFF